MKVKAYLHSSKEAMRQMGEDLGLTSEALDNFTYALYEVELLLDVNKETGDYEVLEIDGKKIVAFENIKDFILEALEIILPNTVFKRFQFTASTKGLFHWEWEYGECFAYKGMKKIGIIDGYNCGVIYRIE